MCGRSSMERPRGEWFPRIHQKLKCSRERKDGSVSNAASGLLLLVIAGVMNASFTLPMKYTRRWAWENTWLAWTLFALLVLPIAITVGTVPHLREVYGSAARGIVLAVIVFGAGWGVAQVFFGLATEAIGIALTFSLVLGTSAAVGTLVPLLRLHPERLNTPAGHGVLCGVALVVAGVLVCAIAGRRRERALKQQALEPQTGVHKSTTLGLLLAILCGFGAAFVNFGLAFGAPLIHTARSFGANTFNASNAVWMPLMLAGAVPNLLYCLWLLRRNRTAGKFGGGGAGHWALAFVMAVFWFGSTLLYGLSAALLGAWGPILGWPLFMSLIVITASLLGMFTGEWKHSGGAPLKIQWAGVSLLVLAVFLLSSTSRYFS
jgi:L-rhamnose-H+ transport protein